MSTATTKCAECGKRFSYDDDWLFGKSPPLAGFLGGHLCTDCFNDRKEQARHDELLREERERQRVLSKEEARREQERRDEEERRHQELLEEQERQHEELLEEQRRHNRELEDSIKATQRLAAQKPRAPNESPSEASARATEQLPATRVIDKNWLVTPATATSDSNALTTLNQQPRWATRDMSWAQCEDNLAQARQLISALQTAVATDRADCTERAATLLREVLSIASYHLPAHRLFVALSVATDSPTLRQEAQRWLALFFDDAAAPPDRQPEARRLQELVAEAGPTAAVQAQALVFPPQHTAAVRPASPTAAQRPKPRTKEDLLREFQTTRRTLPIRLRWILLAIVVLIACYVALRRAPADTTELQQGSTIALRCPSIRAFDTKAADALRADFDWGWLC